MRLSKPNGFLKKMDSKTFNNCFSILQTQYGTISKDEIKNYYQLLKNIQNDIFEAGVKHILQNYTYTSFPKIADIYKACGLDAETKAKVAIAKLREVAPKKNSGNNITFGDPILHQVAMQFDRWENMVFWSSDQWNYNMAKMIDLYIALTKLNSKGEPYISGYYEKQKMSYKTNQISLPWSLFPRVEGKKNLMIRKD